MTDEIKTGGKVHYVWNPAFGRSVPECILSKVDGALLCALTVEAPVREEYLWCWQNLELNEVIAVSSTNFCRLPDATEESMACLRAAWLHGSILLNA